ncbi:hypothetical protein [uncultured Draconibacterium sp.]|uniref:hypothetical protein n=1 Tax=uncultured Draconibacterium sp. TaxID=1573823 RepID=UPI0032167A3B
MRNFITLLFFLGLFSYTAIAQVITEAEINDLLNSREIHLKNPIISNFLMIRQISDDNNAVSIQDNPGDMRNNVLINQNGTGNAGFVEQTGSGLETHLWQYNTDNEANLWSEGKDITVEVKQDGNNNSINSFIENYFLVSRSAYLLQNGNNNRIELALFGDGIPSVSDAQQVQISQTGNDHSVDAILENSFAPITITQTPGVNGEGMQVNISNSTFAFPMK